MKKIISLSLLLFLALTIQVSMAQDNLIIPGKSIGPYTLDMSASYIENWLGEPTTKEFYSNGVVKVLTYETYQMEFCFSPAGGMYHLGTFSSAYMTQEGLKVGMDCNILYNAYQSIGGHTEQVGCATFFRPAPGFDITFKVRKDVIEYISVQNIYLLN